MSFLPREEFLSLVGRAPLVAIDLVITRPDGCALLGQRNNRPAQGFWFVPGGRIRKDERLSDALTRIVQTELGTSAPLTGWRQFGFWEHLYEDNFAGVEGVSTHYLVLAHRLEVSADFSPQCDAQHSGYAWWPREALLASADVHDNTRAYFRP
ncbi:MAG: GDP-mannose mannosyl hydrolase [Rhodocyclaceae bacterium]